MCLGRSNRTANPEVTGTRVATRRRDPDRSARCPPHPETAHFLVRPASPRWRDSGYSTGYTAGTVPAASPPTTGAVPSSRMAPWASARGSLILAFTSAPRPSTAVTTLAAPTRSRRGANAHGLISFTSSPWYLPGPGLGGRGLGGRGLGARHGRVAMTPTVAVAVPTRIAVPIPIAVPTAAIVLRPCDPSLTWVTTTPPMAAPLRGSTSSAYAT